MLHLLHVSQPILGWIPPPPSQQSGSRVAPASVACPRDSQCPAGTPSSLEPLLAPLSPAPRSFLLAVLWSLSFILGYYVHVGLLMLHLKPFSLFILSLNNLIPALRITTDNS